jgi:hypothetical protein
MEEPDIQAAKHRLAFGKTPDSPDTIPLASFFLKLNLTENFFPPSFYKFLPLPLKLYGDNRYQKTI